MRSSCASQSVVTNVTSTEKVCSLSSVHLRRPRLEGISSRYWTPSEKRSQGLVSSGSSTLLPSAVLRPAEHHESSESRRFVRLTRQANSSTILVVSQTACQLLAPLVSTKGSGTT